MKRNKKTGINIKFQHTNGENYLLKMKNEQQVCTLLMDMSCTRLPLRLGICSEFVLERGKPEVVVSPWYDTNPPYDRNPFIVGLREAVVK